MNDEEYDFNVSAMKAEYEYESGREEKQLKYLEEKEKEKND